MVGASMLAAPIEGKRVAVSEGGSWCPSGFLPSLQKDAQSPKKPSTHSFFSLVILSEVKDPRFFGRDAPSE